MKIWVFRLFVFSTISGCAINDMGLVRSRYFANESSYMVLHESWGGYLSTRQADGGLTLGHTERIMIYPKPGNKSGLSIDEFLKQPIGSGFYKELAAEDVGLTDVQPYAWIEKNQGIVCHANPTKIGISAGVETRSVIRLPLDFEGFFIIRYEEGNINTVINKNFKNY
jgi:hypothetical protein